MSVVIGLMALCLAAAVACEVIYRLEAREWRRETR